MVTQEDPVMSLWWAWRTGTHQVYPGRSGSVRVSSPGGFSSPGSSVSSSLFLFPGHVTTVKTMEGDAAEAADVY